MLERNVIEKRQQKLLYNNHEHIPLSLSRSPHDEKCRQCISLIHSLSQDCGQPRDNIILVIDDCQAVYLSSTKISRGEVGME